MHVVKFNPVSKLAEDTVTPPRPAREYWPEWYKSFKAFETKSPEIGEDNVANTTLKLCAPFMDSLSAGYIQETWQDINIDSEEISPGSMQVKYNFPTEPAIIGIRDKVSVALGEEFYALEFTFHPVWIPELPKGWSMLYTTPLNRTDLPFHVLSGIVDNDLFTQSEEKSNIPFYIKKNFSGIIPKGTPMVQMIPIKREDWKAKPQKYSEGKQAKIVTLARQNFWGGYKKVFWNKKTYR